MRKIISSIAIVSAVAGCSSNESEVSEGLLSKAPSVQPRYEPNPVPIPEISPSEQVVPTVDELGVEEPSREEELLESPEYFVTVRPGENLVSLADWAGTSPTELAALNGMQVQDTLYAGQKLGFSLEGEAIDSFVEARENALDARVDRYLERRGGLYTVESYAMRQGDTAWGIAQEKGEIPLWVLSAFNQDVELDLLSIGDSITLPVVEDTIQASAELSSGPQVDAVSPLPGEGESF